MSAAEIRDLCHAEAMKWVDIQRDQFRRLGVMGDWDNPYLTLDPRYEAGILDVLADLRRAAATSSASSSRSTGASPTAPPWPRPSWNTTTRRRRASTSTSRWSRACPSRWGDRPLARDDLDDDPVDPPGQRRDRRPPRPRLRGGPLRRSRHRARPSTRSWRPTWSPRSWRCAGSPTSPRSAACRGRDLEHARYRHPFIDRDEPDRPGRLRQRRGRHGPGPHRPRPRGRGLPDRPHVRPADPEPGRRLGPLHRRGPGRPRGQEGLRGQPARSSRRLRESGLLYHEFSFAHSYPHCWRCKKPVIFRATEQWFVGRRSRRPARRDAQGDRRRRALAPRRGARSRIEAMVSLRPDWCISRQRSWGVPIPALGCDDLRAPAPHGRVRPPLPRPLPPRGGRRLVHAGRSRNCSRPGSTCPKCGGTDFRKEERHPRRLVRVGLQPSLGPGEATSTSATRPSCTSKAPTSTAAGSSRRS